MAHNHLHRYPSIPLLFYDYFLFVLKVPFSLKQQMVYDIIDSVFEISSDASKPNVFKSSIAESTSNVQSLETLECGHIYWITLKKGTPGNTMVLDIPNLVLSDETIGDAGRVTDTCNPPSPTPTPIDECKVKKFVCITEDQTISVTLTWYIKIVGHSNSQLNAGTFIQSTTFQISNDETINIIVMNSNSQLLELHIVLRGFVLLIQTE